MAFITLICPHCGGDFELDPGRNLQPYWICPYCGNRSLMQKNDSSIRLRGIISGKTSLTSYTPSEQPSSPQAQHEAQAAPDALLPSEPPPPAALNGSAVPAIPQNGHPARSLADIIAEAVAEPANESPAVTDQNAEPSPALVDETVNPPENELENIPPDLPPSFNEPPARANAVRPYSPDQPESVKNVAAEFERLCSLAEDAARKRDLPLFNSYSRQAIDFKPTDPRMYAWRAILTEEADGFALATWTLPYWLQLSPLRKQAMIAQHLYNLCTALRFSRPEHRQDLISQVARLIIKQAVDHFNEQATLRCEQNLIFRKFKGRYKNRDMNGSTIILDALRSITPKACPVSHPELLASLRIEIRLLPPRVARKFKRF